MNRNEQNMSNNQKSVCHLDFSMKAKQFGETLRWRFSAFNSFQPSLWENDKPVSHLLQQFELHFIDQWTETQLLKIKIQFIHITEPLLVLNFILDKIVTVKSLYVTLKSSSMTSSSLSFAQPLLCPCTFKLKNLCPYFTPLHSASQVPNKQPFNLLCQSRRNRNIP